MDHNYSSDEYNKLNGFYTMLTHVYEIEKMSENEEPETFYIIKYNQDDNYYEIHPHYEFITCHNLVLSIPDNATGLLYDEHGKLVSGFEYKDKHFVSQKFVQNKKSQLFGVIENSIESNFEDYRLKRLISRYITLIETHGVTKEVKFIYGSTELAHLLWMLKHIYKKSSRSLLERYMFLGYIQGVLSSKNFISVRHERDVMHDLF